jgi:hypothetical protein
LRRIFILLLLVATLPILRRRTIARLSHRSCCWSFFCAACHLCSRRLCVAAACVTSLARCRRLGCRRRQRLAPLPNDREAIIIQGDRGTGRGRRRPTTDVGLGASADNCWRVASDLAPCFLDQRCCTGARRPTSWSHVGRASVSASSSPRQNRPLAASANRAILPRRARRGARPSSWPGTSAIEAEAPSAEVRGEAALSAGPVCGPCLLACCCRRGSGAIGHRPRRWPSAATTTARCSRAAAARCTHIAVVAEAIASAVDECTETAQ